MREGLTPDPLEQVFTVVRDWGQLHGWPLWPADDTEKKRFFVRFCSERGFLTLLADPQGRLEGFLFFYRSHQFEGMDVQRPEPAGKYVVCDVFWIRPDLTRTDAADRLIRKAVTENRDKILGAEKIVFFREWNGFNPVIYDFPAFFRRFYGKRRIEHSTAAAGFTVHNGHSPERDRRQGPGTAGTFKTCGGSPGLD